MLPGEITIKLVTVQTIIMEHMIAAIAEVFPTESRRNNPTVEEEMPMKILESKAVRIKCPVLF